MGTPLALSMYHIPKWTLWVNNSPHYLGPEAAFFVYFDHLKPVTNPKPYKAPLAFVALKKKRIPRNPRSQTLSYMGTWPKGGSLSRDPFCNSSPTYYGDQCSQSLDLGQLLERIAWQAFRDVRHGKASDHYSYC